MKHIGLVLAFLALASCVDRSASPTVPEALEIGSNYRVFAASTRLPEGPDSFGYRRSDQLRYLNLTVSIPPNREPGTLRFGYGNPNPRRNFTMANREIFPDAAAFRADLRRTMNAHPLKNKEVTIFVHGFNATQSETAFRAAQLAHDIDMPGEMMVYSWPSRGNPLAYAYDSDSALFARDGLEQTLREVKAAGARRILLVAHSMGSLLTMETLRQLDIKDPGWAGRNLGGVILISPDLDVDVFRKQMSLISNPPRPFVVFVSAKDKILNLSARLRGTHNTPRLGNRSSAQLVSDLPIEIVDTTEFSDTAGSAHFVPATSPALLAMLQGARQMNRTFRQDETSFESMIVGVSVERGPDSEIILRPLSDSPR